MKTEEFEDALRQKIESINPLYEENEIDKVHDYVSQNRSPYSTKRLGYFVAASLAGLLIAGLLLWNISQWNEHKDLIQKIETLQKNLVQSKIKAQELKTDTVFVKEYVHDATPDKALAQSELANINGNKQINKQENNAGNKFANDFLYPKEKPDTKEDIVSNNVTESSANDNNNVQIIEKEELSNQQDSIQNKVEETLAIKETLEDTSSQETAFDTTKQAVKTHHNLFAFLKNWRYQAGLGYETANRQLGYNGYGEVLLNNKWSFSAGLKWLNINNESYDDDDDFHHRKGKHFQSTYNKNVSDGTADISDIDVHDKIIQIPIAVTYHIYLKHYFSLLISAGSDLEIYTKQIIGYKHSDGISIDELSSFETNYPSRIFNNLVLSLGIEKRWKRLVFQAKPFISPQLQSVTYKKEDLYYGLHVNVAYAFGGR